MKMAMKNIVCVLAVSLMGATARADVWTDCQACYRGGFDDNGNGNWFEGAAGKYGEFIDVLHAADTTDWRHKCTNFGCADQYLYYYDETVTSACANAVFPVRKILRIDPTRGRADKGTADPDPTRCLPSGINLAACSDTTHYLITNDEWTALYRFRMDRDWPVESDRIYLADLGYDAKDGFLINFSNKPANNELMLTCYGYDGNKSTGLYLTNNIVTSKYDVWTELAVVVSNRTVRLGLFQPGCSAQWVTVKNIGNTTAKPGNKRDIRLGYYYNRAGTYFKGAFDLAAFWNRQLSDGEVYEAFGAGHPAILKLGAEGCSTGLFAGKASVTNVNALAADVRGVPATFSTGSALTIDYTVPELQANLAQALRIVVSEANATFDVSVDGVSVGTVAATPTRPGVAFVPAGRFTAGDHALKLLCTAGTGAVLETVELTGSWRLGLEDGLPTGFGSYGVGTGWCETTAEKAGQKDFYLGLRDNIINVRFGEANPGMTFESTHVWPEKRYQNIHFTLTPEMALRGRYEFAYRLSNTSSDFPTAEFPPEIEVLVNGVSRQVERLFRTGTSDQRLHTLKIQRDWLKTGDNVITTRYAHNVDSTGTVGHEIRYDYYKFTLTKFIETQGLVIMVR